jgi:hypothetical protein
LAKEIAFSVETQFIIDNLQSTIIVLRFIFPGFKTASKDKKLCKRIFRPRQIRQALKNFDSEAEIKQARI